MNVSNVFVDALVSKISLLIVSVLFQNILKYKNLQCIYIDNYLSFGYYIYQLILSMVSVYN